MNKFRKLGFIDYNGHLRIHSSLLSVFWRNNHAVWNRRDAWFNWPRCARNRPLLNCGILRSRTTLRPIAFF
jgi:hypothetical protein